VNGLLHIQRDKRAYKWPQVAQNCWKNGYEA